jgi:hypothetical protein
MECPKCGATMKFVAAGVSQKTGKPYTAFYACPSCKQTISAGQSDGQVQSVGEVLSKRGQPAPVSATQTPDWDAIAVGKCASTYIEALITSGTKPRDITADDLVACFRIAKEVVHWGRD